MGTFFTATLGLGSSGSGLLGRRVGFTGSGASGSGSGSVGCVGVGVEVRVERIEAADGFGTGCFGGGITDGRCPGLVGEG